MIKIILLQILKIQIEIKKNQNLKVYLTIIMKKKIMKIVKIMSKIITKMIKNDLIIKQLQISIQKIMLILMLILTIIIKKQKIQKINQKKQKVKNLRMILIKKKIINL